MPLATAVITYDLSDLVGAPHYKGTSVTATTNIPSAVIADTDGNQIRIGSGKGSINTDGTGQIDVWIPGTGSNPASWQTYFHIRHRDSSVHSGYITRTLGPFTITASGDLADLIEEQAVPPEYAGVIVEQMEALLAQQESLAAIDDTDTAVAYAMEYGAEAAPYLSATYAPRQLPAYSDPGARTKSFDFARSVYNPESPNMAAIHARIANGVIGGGSRCQVLMLGHSYMAGSQTTIGTNDLGTSLRQRLAARTGTVVRAGISAFRNGETRDSHYTSVSAGWGTPGGAALTFYATSTTNGDALTYTSTEVGNTLTIFVTNDSTAFTYAIDGGAPVAVTAVDGTLTVRRITVTGLSSATTHTCVITKTGTGVTRFIGCGINDVRGVEIYNFGYGGSTSAQWISLASGEKRAVATSCATQRDVVLIELDTNDARPGGGNLTGPQWKTSVAQVIASHVGLGHPTALVLSIDAPDTVSPITSARWDEYGKAAYELAEQYNIPLLDTRHFMHGWTIAQPYLGAGDSLHLNTRGYYRMAEAIGGLLVT